MGIMISLAYSTMAKPYYLPTNYPQQFTGYNRGYPPFHSADGMGANVPNFGSDNRQFITNILSRVVAQGIEHTRKRYGQQIADAFDNAFYTQSGPTYSLKCGGICPAQGPFGDIFVQHSGPRYSLSCGGKCPGQEWYVPTNPISR